MKTNETTMSTENRTSHTPGPWTEDAGFIVGTFGDGQMHDICDPRCAPIELRAEMDANARLIAAAPELLEALERAAEWIKATDEDYDLNDAWLATQAAIARATGQTL